MLRGGGISGRKEENCGFLAGAKVLGAAKQNNNFPDRVGKTATIPRLVSVRAARITARARMLVAVWTSFPVRRQFQRLGAGFNGA